NLPAGVSSAVVNYPAPQVSDDCGVASMNCSPPSGSTFDLGSHPVTCTAVDTAGNTNSCTFTITVRATPPDPCPDVTGSWINLTQTCRLRRGIMHCKLRGRLQVENTGSTNAPTSFVRY